MTEVQEPTADPMFAQAALMAKMQSEKASDAALADPEMMRLWGELNFLWDEIETSLYLAFDAMMLGDGFSTRAIFYSVKTHAGRRDMVIELAKTYFKFRQKSKSKVALDNAMNRVKARSGTRNDLTHGFWGWHMDGTAMTYECVRFTATPQFSPDSKSYRKADLRRERDAMESTLMALRSAVSPIFEAKLRYSRQRHDIDFDSNPPLVWPPPLP